jgi:hypothetical protein
VYNVRFLEYVSFRNKWPIRAFLEMADLQELTQEVNRIVTASYDVSLQVSAQLRRAERPGIGPTVTGRVHSRKHRIWIAIFQPNFASHLPGMLDVLDLFTIFDLLTAC